MADDYIVDSLSDSAIRDHASATLRWFGVATSSLVDVLDLMKRSEILSVFGKRRLIFELLTDEELGENDAQTVFAKDSVSIQVRHCTFEDASRGLGRARMTLAHELGHAVLHRGPTMGRRAVENQKPKYIPAHQSAEHHAKVFASAFLMPKSLIGCCISVQEIVDKAGVSYESARIQWEQLHVGEKKKYLAGKLRLLSDELRDISNKKDSRRFLTDPCPLCTRQAMISIGVKVMCLECDEVFDGYQDGDVQS